jgi:predicted metal-dependent phosphoesterase TrpH
MTAALAVSSAGRVDLHSHSTASDGALSPGQLVRAAAAAGLTGLALTDHDTVDGLAEFLAAGLGTPLKLIGGVEISLEHPGTFHLLGLNVAGDSASPAALNRLKTFRVERNLKMLDRIGRLGYHISWDVLLEAARGGQLGRPHFADILVARGFFNNRDEVFEKLLGKGRPGYVDKTRLSPEEGLSMVRAAGWAPVLAHPVSLGLAAGDWPAWLGRLTDGGLLGLEVCHPSHSQEQSDFLGGLARRFGLAPTAGSDFHGEAKPASPLGWTIRNSPFGWETVEELRSKLDSKR